MLVGVAEKLATGGFVLALGSNPFNVVGFEFSGSNHGFSCLSLVVPFAVQ